jgi:plastocyanin
MRVRWQGTGILVALLALALPAPSLAANATVTATGASIFTPRGVTVDPGDTVTWNNAGGFHNVHFDDESFVQPQFPTGTAWSVSRTFTNPGTYRYYCQLHGAPNGVGMSGTVIVRSPGLDAKVIHTPLAVAYKPCPLAAANRQHAGPLDYPACAPPVQVSDWLTVGTYDSNRRVANSAGFIRVVVEPGDTGTPADEANVQLSAIISDVRSKGDLSDYTGELQAVLPLRITDDSNGDGTTFTERATGDTTFAFSIPCTPSEDPDAGSSCEVRTTADAVSPGAVVEGKSSTWEVGQVQVFDGGADGLADTAGNTLFMTQAVFVP